MGKKRRQKRPKKTLGLKDLQMRRLILRLQRMTRKKWKTKWKKWRLIEWVKQRKTKTRKTRKRKIREVKRTRRGERTKSFLKKEKPRLLRGKRLDLKRRQQGRQKRNLEMRTKRRTLR